jgi:hypothetical protein
MKEGGMLVRTPMLFRKFGISLWGQMMEVHSQHNYKGLAWMAATQILAGGINVFLNPVTGSFILRHAKKKELRDKIAKEQGEKAADLLFNGITGFMGIDMANRFFSMPLRPAYSSGGWIYENLTGVAGSQAKVLTNSIQRLLAKEPKDDAIVDAMAGVFGAWGRSAQILHRIYKYDTMTARGGRPIIDNKLMGEFNVALKACGFQPLDLTQMYELVMVKREVETIAKDTKEKISNLFTSAINNGDSKYIEEAKNVLSKYSESYGDMYPLDFSDCVDTLKNNVGAQHLDIFMRELKRTPVAQRPWMIEEMIEAYDHLEGKDRVGDEVIRKLNNIRRRVLQLPKEE